MLNHFSRAFVALPLLTTMAIGQSVVDAGPNLGEAGPIAGEYLVHLKRSTDLTPLRQAIMSGASVEAVDRIVQSLQVKVDRERAAFAASVARLGGAVVKNFWIVDVSYVRIDNDRAQQLLALDGVARLEQNASVPHALGTSTNANNHNSDRANTLRNSAQQLVVGTGLTVAILDTGIDAAMSSAGRPHRSFFVNGDPGNRSGTGIGNSRVLGRFAALGAGGNGEDDNGHGTSCASCSAGARWPGNDAGFAPNANIVSWKVSLNSRGSASLSSLTDAWQQTLANVARYKIVAANNSYSGSPTMTSSTQQAADRLAYVGNVNVCVPSGNSASNVRGTQAGYNGLNSGSINKNTSSRSSFSGFGTQSSGKVVPDIAAIGASVLMTRRDSETSVSRASGTSFSSPSVAGAAVLVRHANSQITALEAKAVLLNTTRPQTMGSGRGAGVLRADLAVDAAIKGEFAKGQLSAARPVVDYFFSVQQGVRHSVTLTWYRKNTGSSANNNLNLSIYDGSTLIASSTRSSANSYEKVEFVAPRSGTYRARIDGTRVDTTVDFAVAGAGKTSPPKKPSLTAISPASTPILSSGPITLRGTDLQGVSEVLLGTKSIPAKNATSTSVQFDAPVPDQLGPIAVTVRSAGGTSNALTLTFVGQHPPVLQGPATLISNGVYSDVLFCDDGWVGVHFFSPSNTPSRIAGVVDLGIGNNFQSLIQWNVFVCDKGGVASQRWVMPAGFANLTFYSQVVAIDGKTLKLPFESSNVLRRIVFF